MRAWFKQLASWHLLGAGKDQTAELEPPIEYPWRQSWDYTPQNSAGKDFRRRDYDAARQRGRDVARATLGETLWAELHDRGYLDLPSQRTEGLTYRLRVGRRIELRRADGARLGSPRCYLCVNPKYPLPGEEFFAQLYLYLRDREGQVLSVAIPQAHDGPIARTF